LWLATKCLDAPTPEWVFSELKLPSWQKSLIQCMSAYMLAHFSLAHLTQIWDETKHPLTAALIFTYLTYQPDQSLRQLGRRLESVLHG
jgi:hypothetical protein